MSGGSHPFHDLRAGYLEQKAEILAAIERALDSGWYVLGNEVKAFEHEYARSIGVKHAIGVANATDALTLALRALDVKAGDGVAIPALTAIPTAMAVKALGANPVLVDIDPRSFTMDPNELEASIGKNVKAIVPVHLYGQFAAIDEILAIGGKHGIPVIEDAAQAHGAKFDGQQAGTFGRLACFSFYPTKNLGTFGDGGAIVTNDDALMERVKRLRFYGQVDGYDCVETGQNSRLDEIHAAILRVRSKALEAGNATRRATADRYRREIQNPAVSLPIESPRRHHVYHQFVVRSDRRDALRAHLAKKGVETLIHYPRALTQMTALRPHAAASRPCKNAEAAVATILSLPIYPQAPSGTIDAAIDAVNSFR